MTADVLVTPTEPMGPRALGPRALGPRALGPRALGPWALGPRALGPRALGPWALGPQALGPWAQGPLETRGTPRILEILPPPVPTRAWAEIRPSGQPLTGTRFPVGIIRSVLLRRCAGSKFHPWGCSSAPHPPPGRCTSCQLAAAAAVSGGI